MYTSKQVQNQKHNVVQIDEKRGIYGVENGEMLYLWIYDTRGMVCMELLNDTHGSVDKHKA